MKAHVTVIPSDHFISVDGVPLWFPYEAPANLHALQWHETGGHREWTDGPNTPLSPEDFDEIVGPFVTLYDAEYARLVELANTPPTLEAAKDAKHTEVKSAFAAAESGGYVESSLGFRIDATRKSIEDIEGLIDLVSAGVMTAPVTFRDYDNVYHELNLEQLNIMRLEAKARGPILYARKWELGAQIDACTTVNEVEAIDVTIGWAGSTIVSTKPSWM